MKQNTDLVLKWLGLSEGGYSNHPDDPGGATMYGVTQRVYNAKRKTQGLPIQSVRHISKAEANEIFVEQYFAPVWFDHLPSGLDYCMADYSVNSGPSQATKDLQKALRGLGHDLAVDGHMGFVTMAAARAEDPAKLVRLVCESRMAFLKRLRNWNSFKTGWTRRVMGEEPGPQDYDNGVIDRGVRMARSLPERGTPKPAAGKAPVSISWVDSFTAMVAAALYFLKGGK